MAQVHLALDALGKRDLFMLSPEVTYLNHGSFGACPREVFADYQHWQAELESEPVDFIGRRAPELMTGAREQLAAFLATEPDEIAFVTNVTMGMNIVAHSLGLQPGDEILSTDLEYGAIDNVWDNICECTGAKIVRAPVPLEGGSVDDIVEAIWSQRTEHTRAMSISHITSFTATIMPIERLIARCREAGIFSVVDGAHAPGQIPLDMHAVGADAYVGDCHKWLMAPKGSGFMYVDENVRDMVRPLIVSHRLKNEDGTQPKLWARQEQQGTRDPAAFLAVPTALRFAREHDWDSVRKQAHELVCYAIGSVSELTGLAPFYPNMEERIAMMGLAPLPPCDAGELHRRLWEDHKIELPILGRNDRHHLRISIQGYNSLDDVNALLGALERILPDVTK